MQILGRIISIFLLLINCAYAAEVQEHTLANGLRVIVKEDHRAPIAVTQIWYKVGSSFEHRGITGLSHALEHLMFKATNKYESGDIPKIVAQNGGYQNAFTSDDFTAYYEVLPASKVEVAFEIEADRMKNLLFDATETKKELEVIKEERRMRVEDNPQSYAFERHMTNAHIASPYRIPTIGWMEDIENMNIEQLKSWYDTWYAPNNATLIVVGDVNSKDIFALAKKHFAKIKTSELPALPSFNELEDTGYRRAIITRPAKVPFCLMSFNVPSLKKPELKADIYALVVLAEVLDGSLSARFEKELIRKQQVATETFADYSPLSRMNTLFLLGFTPRQDIPMSELKQAVYEQLSRVKKVEVSEQELERVKTRIKAEKLFAEDSQRHQAMLLGQLASLDLPLSIANDYPNEVAKVTAKQVQQVAAKYLDKNNLAITELYPQAEEAE